MIVVDSSVWIDYFNGRETPETNKLDTLLGVESLAIALFSFITVCFAQN
jgi:predicted nucleic acid-binding protein